MLCRVPNVMKIIQLCSNIKHMPKNEGILKVKYVSLLKKFNKMKWIVYLYYKWHYVKTVRIRSYSGQHFSRIFPHSDWIRRGISPCSVRMRENVGKMLTRITPNTDSFYAVWPIKVTPFHSKTIYSYSIISS